MSLNGASSRLRSIVWDRDKIQGERINVAIVLALIVQHDVLWNSLRIAATLIVPREVGTLIGPQSIIKQESLHRNQDAGWGGAFRRVGVVRRTKECDRVIDESRPAAAVGWAARVLIVRPLARLEDEADAALKPVSALNDAIRVEHAQDGAVQIVFVPNGEVVGGWHGHEIRAAVD